MASANVRFSYYNYETDKGNSMSVKMDTAWAAAIGTSAVAALPGVATINNRNRRYHPRYAIYISTAATGAQVTKKPWPIAGATPQPPATLDLPARGSATLVSYALFDIQPEKLPYSKPVKTNAQPIP